MAFSPVPDADHRRDRSDLPVRAPTPEGRLTAPGMVSGEWTGTMNLTEPLAGSDSAAVRSRAVPQGDGTYKRAVRSSHHLRRLT